MPIKKRHPDSFQQVTGKLTGFRQATTLRLARGAVRLDNHWLLIDFPALSDPDKTGEEQEKAGKALLEQLQTDANSQRQAVAGIRQRHDGRDELMWLMTRDHQVLPPPRRRLIKESGLLFMRWFAFMLIGTGLAIWSGFHAFQSISWLWILVFLVAIVATGLCSVITLMHLTGLIRAVFSRTLRASNRAMAQACREHAFSDIVAASRSVTSPAADDSTDTRPCPSAVDNSEANRTHLLRGRASNIRVADASTGGSYLMPLPDGGIVNANTSMRFDLFVFHVANRQCALLASDDFGGGELILAEDDEVELIVSAAPDTDDDEPSPLFVWAVRNRTDGTTYACHRAMSSQARPFRKQLTGKARMTAFTVNNLRWARRMVGLAYGLALTLFLLMFLIIGDGFSMVLIAGFVIPAIWLIVFECPVFLMRLTWRKGHPSRAQRMSNRVYNSLGCKPAWIRNHPIIDI